MDIEERVKQARDAFNSGYNCAQAVVCGYLDMFDMSKSQLMKLASGMGGGIGQSREICGTLVGASMVIGQVHSDETQPQSRMKVNKTVRSLINEFNDHHHSVVCKELLGIVKTDKEVVKWPCCDMVEEVVRLLEKYVVE